MTIQKTSFKIPIKVLKKNSWTCILLIVMEMKSCWRRNQNCPEIQERLEAMGERRPAAKEIQNKPVKLQTISRF